MFCQHCGVQANESAGYCESCGKPLATPLNAIAEVVDVATKQSPPSTAAKPGKARRILNRLGYVVAVLLIAAYIVQFVPTSPGTFLHDLQLAIHAQEAKDAEESGDFTSAFESYKKGAAMGSAYMQVRLAQMYEQGRGVRQDQRKALEWFEKAAAQGNQDAIAALQSDEQSAWGQVAGAITLMNQLKQPLALGFQKIHTFSGMTRDTMSGVADALSSESTDDYIESVTVEFAAGERLSIAATFGSNASDDLVGQEFRLATMDGGKTWFCGDAIPLQQLAGPKPIPSEYLPAHCK